MEELISWLISVGAVYYKKSSTHTGFYLYKNETFSISFYDKENRIYIHLVKSDKGDFLYPKNIDAVKNIYQSFFNLS